MSYILSPPTFSYPLRIYSDGNNQYTKALKEYFRPDSIIYGQVIKHKLNGRLIWRTKQAVFRNPEYQDIDTNVIENYNGVLRERISRLVRRSKGYSKRRDRFEGQLDIYQAYNNLIKLNNGKTPLILEGKTSKIWCWEDFFNIR